MNKKGFITPLLVLAIVMGSLMIMGVSYQSVAIKNVRIEEAETDLTGLIDSRTAYERIEGVIRDNPLVTGVVDFEDIDKSLQIEEKSRTEDYRIIKATVMDSLNDVPYEALSRTIRVSLPKKMNDINKESNQENKVGGAAE